MKQVALQKWIALLKTLDFFVSGGQVFLSSFLGSLSRRVNSGSPEPRTAQCSLRVSGSLQPRGRWARSGSQQSAGAFGALMLLVLLACSSLLHVLLQWSEDILMDELAVMDEEQRAPGGWRAPRPLPGALRHVRNFHRCVSENLTSLSSSLVPHARFSLHPSFCVSKFVLVAQSGCHEFMRGPCMVCACMIIQWLCMSTRIHVLHMLLEFGEEQRRRVRVRRIRGRRSAVEKLAPPQQTLQSCMSRCGKAS